MEKPQFDKPEFIRPPYKVKIEQPVFDKPAFDEPQFDRMQRQFVRVDRNIYDRNRYERAQFDNQCDIKKLSATSKVKKQERYIPMEKKYRFKDAPQFSLAPKKATDCDCTAATTPRSLPIN